MSVYDRLVGKIRREALHFSLVDPDEIGYERAAEFAAAAEDAGTDAILIGGTVGVQGELLDETVKDIKNAVKIPVILFPGDISGISPFADALLYLSLLNSRNPYYISGVQALAAPIVLRWGLEVIPTAYLITEPGGETAAGWVGDARPLPVRKPSITYAYALSARFIGYKFVYLEAGSGAAYPVDDRLVMVARKALGREVPLIVGGGIRDPETAAQKVRAGADVIVTGTALENSADVERTVRSFVEAVKGVERDF
ncbi:MAG: phosphoglycerol geranylgeranyltransferase [Candidatus Diapherotrites archaeon]|nr:phosphoglycerol geranylgeranyltransferase [Candidatus Diapherotrites archaeon]MDN5366893.1 phosphoglycerol geranylgeranyltransferase [Candidatus Diapherotrites archaeon]